MESLRTRAHADAAFTTNTLLPFVVPGSGFFGKSAQIDSSSGNSLAVATPAERAPSLPSAAVETAMGNGLTLEAGATRGEGAEVERVGFLAFFFLRFLSANTMASAAASNFVELKMAWNCVRNEASCEEWTKLRRPRMKYVGTIKAH